MARIGTVAGTVVLLALLAALSPVPHADGAGSGYRIYETQGRSREPVRWNPCAPITYKVNASGLAGRAAVGRARRAVAEAARASGITFRYAGTTRFVPDDRERPVPRSVGADVVITWAYPGSGARRSALLSNVARLAGVGGYGSARSNRGFQVARSGFVVFDASRIFRMSTRKQFVVALHELGHLLGLDDVHDARQVMNSVVLDRGPSHYGAGDRAGLARLGRRAGCLAPAPAPPRPTVVRSGDLVRIATSRVTSVSGSVAYTLSSPELGGAIATAATPQFSLPLATVARLGAVGQQIHFRVSAGNRIGDTASQPVAYQVPRAVLTTEPSLVVTPTSFEVVQPRAVLAGTNVDVTDQLTVSTDGVIEVHKANGGSFQTDFSQHIVLYGTTVTAFDVTGTVRVVGPGLDRTFDLTGSYATGAVPDPPVVTPTDTPTSTPTPLPTEPQSPVTAAS